MSNCCSVGLHVEEAGGASLHVTDGGGASLHVGGSMYAVGPPLYTGPLEVTPSQSTQVLATNGTRMDSDVTINPIPSNYGLITWDGSVLTVS